MFRCYAGLAETLLIFKVVSADFFSSLSSCGEKLAVTVCRGTFEGQLRFLVCLLKKKSLDKVRLLTVKT